MLRNLSYWEKSTYLEDIDLVIIGSGIVGLNAAISFKTQYKNAKVVVLERGVFPSGASTKNAGFACFGSVSELLEDIEIMGETAVWDLVEKRWTGLIKLKERCGAAAIDFQQHGGYELFFEEDRHSGACKDAIPYLNEKLSSILGVKDTFSIESNKHKFGFGKIQQLIFNKLEGQINPAKMMAKLRQIAIGLGIDILTGISVINLEETESGVVLNLNNENDLSTANVLVATNGFAKQLVPNLELQPARNQVIITDPIPNLKLKGTFHYDRGYYYFRNIANRILFGGARNLAKDAETTTEFGLSTVIQNQLELFLKEIILPQQSFQIAHRWSGILGIGNQKAPIVKMAGKHIGVAVRLGGMGVAIGSLVGEEGAKLF